MPAVFASGEDSDGVSHSSYRATRAEAYAKGLRLRRPPTKSLEFHLSDVWGLTQNSSRDITDLYEEDEFRSFTYQPIRDDATLKTFARQHRTDKKEIGLFDYWSSDEDGPGNTVASPFVCAVGVGDPGCPIEGVMILRRWATVSPAPKRRGLEVAYDIEMEVVYVARKARGKLYGWALAAYAAKLAFDDLDHLARQMRTGSQRAALCSRLSGQYLSHGAEKMFDGLYFQLDTVYGDRAKIVPNEMYRGYTGCEMDYTF